MAKLKILVEMKHGLGDCVCMLPALSAIRENYPDAYIALLINGEANQEIFEHSQIPIDDYFYFSLKNRSIGYTVETLAKLFFKHFDIGVLATMTPPKKGMGLFKLLGVKRCFGEQYDGWNFLDLDDSIHFVHRNLNIVSKFCPNLQNQQPRLYPKMGDGVKFQNFKKSKHIKIAVSIGGADKNYYKGKYVFTRNWKKEYMHTLVDLLSRNQEYDIFLLGGKLEESLIGDYVDLLGRNNIFNFVNQTSIGESIYLLSVCQLAVGVDTGMQHIADALGVPTVSIFGPTNPKTHGAFSKKATFVLCNPKLDCQFCFDHDIYYTCPDRKCLNEISAQMVYNEILKKLKDGRREKYDNRTD